MLDSAKPENQEYTEVEWKTFTESYLRAASSFREDLDRTFRTDEDSTNILARIDQLRQAIFPSGTNGEISIEHVGEYLAYRDFFAAYSNARSPLERVILTRNLKDPTSTLLQKYSQISSIRDMAAKISMISEELEREELQELPHGEDVRKRIETCLEDPLSIGVSNSGRISTTELTTGTIKRALKEQQTKERKENERKFAKLRAEWSGRFEIFKAAYEKYICSLEEKVSEAFNSIKGRKTPEKVRFEIEQLIDLMTLEIDGLESELRREENLDIDKIVQLDASKKFIIILQDFCIKLTEMIQESSGLSRFFSKSVEVSEDSYKDRPDYEELLECPYSHWTGFYDRCQEL
jgi:hypothetical protein